MTAKIFANLFYAAAVSSLAYASFSGNYTVAGVGVAVSWIVILLVLVVLALSLLVHAAGTDEQKVKIKQSLADGVPSKVLGSIKPAVLFLLLCISGFWFTAIVYGLASLTYRGVCGAAAAGGK